MKKSFKGFTLIECIVSLAVLGVASLTLVQIYASVAKMNKENHFLNESISNQVAYAEKQNGADTVDFNEFLYGNSTNPDPQLSTTKQPPHTVHGSTNQVGDSYIKITDPSGNEYSYPVDIYILKNRDDENKTDAATDYDEYNAPNDGDTDGNLRYKYFTAH